MSNKNKFVRVRQCIRRRRMMQARLAGRSWGQIAMREGLDKNNARRAVLMELTRLMGSNT